jgi:predicted SprT family Zn-dependent metalloprotease
MNQTKKRATTIPSGPLTAQVKSTIATMIHIEEPNTFQFGCSCGGKVFHILRLPVERKRKIKTAHQFRIVGRCVDCQKALRLAFGGIKCR